MARSLSIGLELVADDPSLTFVFFIALALLGAISVRFAYYAYLNMRTTDLPVQQTLWESLVYVGVAGFLYGLLGILEIVSTLQIPAKQGVIVAFLFLLAVSFRRISVAASTGTATTMAGGGLLPGRRSVEAGFATVVLVLVGGLAILGAHSFLIALEGVTALVVAGYGYRFVSRQTSRTHVSGTMIDTLLRQLLPVLLFGAMISVLDLATLLGIERVVVLHVRVVFVIITATALMTATIKLRQNLASL